MNVREIGGTIVASAGWLLGTSSGSPFQEIAAIVLLVGGIAAAWYGSRQKVNLATARTAAETWQTLAEAREAQIVELQTDKENLRHQIERLNESGKIDRERILVLEARPVLDDIQRQNEDHHQANLKHFEHLGEILAGQGQVLAGQTTLLSELTEKVIASTGGIPAVDGPTRRQTDRRT